MTICESHATSVSNGLRTTLEEKERERIIALLGTCQSGLSTPPSSGWIEMPLEDSHRTYQGRELMPAHQTPYMMEVTYPYYMGGEMMDGYQCDDQIMAQSSIDSACASATRIERERIIALLTETHAGLKAVLAMAHPEGDGSELIALIKGEN